MNLIDRNGKITENIKIVAKFSSDMVTLTKLTLTETLKYILHDFFYP